MSASWMLACTFVSMLLAGAALALARAITLYRGAPLRWIWAGAAVLSLLLAAPWLRPTRAADRPAAQLPAITDGLPRTRSAHSNRLTTPVSLAIIAVRRPFAIEFPHLPRVVDRVVVRAWAAASACFIVLLIVAVLRMRVERKEWTWRVVANATVLVSRNFGPAIIGVRDPAIVLPEWVLALDDSAQRAIVAHEAEHRSARDPALMLAGLAALIVMPWNMGLWMIWRGLRRSIELDCDARVLARGMDGAEYARVLLGAWRSAHSGWMPSVAFAERASGLSARVEHMMRPEPRRRVMRTAVGTMTAAGLIVAACAIPSPKSSMNFAEKPYPLVIIDGVKRPDLPPLLRYTGAVVAETTTTPTYRVTYRGTTETDADAKTLYPSRDEIEMVQYIAAPASVVLFGTDAQYGAELYYTKKYRAAGGPIIAPTEGSHTVSAANPSTAPTEFVRRIFADLFNGIVLSPVQAGSARTIIETEFEQQRALKGPVLVIWPRRIVLNAKRDAELRALLTSDADRAKFEVHSLEGRPAPTPTAEAIERSIYSNLMRDIVLRTDQQARAHAIIQQSLADEMAAYERAPSSIDEARAIRERREVDLRAVLSTEADKAKFDGMVRKMREVERRS